MVILEESNRPYLKWMVVFRVYTKKILKKLRVSQEADPEQKKRGN